jgi:hypothetical protein
MCLKFNLFSECHRAGTGNDYIGTLNVTRSKRMCQKWTEGTPHKASNCSYSITCSGSLNGLIFTSSQN